jgi:Sulfatase
MRVEGRRLLELAALTGLAVVQPLLDVLGRSPETFIFRGVGGGDLVVFAVAVAVLPALVLWLVGLLAGLAGPRVREAVHRGTLAVLGAITLLVALKSADLLYGAGALAIAVLVAAGGLWLYHRFAGARLFLLYLAVLPLLAVGAFLLTSPASGLVGGHRYEVVDHVDATTPVVMLVLDELPTAALLDVDGEIDADRYPGFARLAAGSRWFRNYSAVNNLTQYAVPSMLTGGRPYGDRAPVHWDYPHNLFTLLGGSYEMDVIEAVSQLCPSGLCRGGGPGGAGLRGLTDDAVSVLRQLVSLDHLPDPESDLLVEAMPEARSVDDEGNDRDGFNLPLRFETFLERLEPASGPTLDFLHLVLPHEPFRFYPDGTEYVAPHGDPRGDPAGVWAAAWPADLTRLRFELQARYVDALVSRMLDRLEATGLWDDAVVVVAADHGASFIPGQGRRILTEANAHELLWSALFVRTPDLEPGRSDVNVQSPDLLPTIADLLDIELPWPVDGHSVLRRTEDGSTDRTYYRFPKLLDPGPEAVIPIDGEEGLGRVLHDPRPRFDVDDPVGEFYRDAALGELYDRPVAELEVGGPIDATAAVEDLEDFTEGSDGRVPASFRGVLGDEAVGDDAWVVLAVDGVVGGFSPLYLEEAGDRGFALLLDQDRVRADGNSIQVFVTDGPGQPLHPIGATDRS